MFEHVGMNHCDASSFRQACRPGVTLAIERSGLWVTNVEVLRLRYA